jgi:molybdopterin molybdotransferase
MLELDEARERILAAARPVERERVPLEDADGRVLAETIVASGPLPAFDASAMDGYALSVGDLIGSGPWTLPVRGESRTGHPAPRLERGSACRIFTGAELPSGADAVVIQEEVELRGGRVTVGNKPERWDNLRRAGEELAAGQVALAAGTRLGPAQLGLAASLDVCELFVARRPKVTILCTGDELRAPGTPKRPGSIPNSNAPALTSMVKRAGAVVRSTSLVEDRVDVTRDALADALGKSDLVLTVGGASVGDHDQARAALGAAGVELAFWKVNIKPGKPLFFGRAERSLVLGLPGNPVSALVTCLLFGVPLIRALQGDRQPLGPVTSARLSAPLRYRPGRLGFVRARWQGSEEIAPLENQSSGAATSIAWADVLIVVPKDSNGYQAGDRVTVIALDQP